MSDWYDDRDPYWRYGREWMDDDYDGEGDSERGNPYPERRGVARVSGRDTDRAAYFGEHYEDDQDYGSRWARGPRGFYRAYPVFERPDYRRGYGSYDRFFAGDESEYDADRRFGGRYNRGRAGYGYGGFGSRPESGYGYGARPGGVERPGPYGNYPRGRYGYGRPMGDRRYRGYSENYDFEDELDREDELYYDSDYEPGYWTYTEYWLIPGPYTGMGPQGFQRADDRIREDVCERLTQHGQVDASDIDIQVQDGQVYLRGEVDSRHAKRMAEDTVETVAGVKEIHNELRLRKGMHERGQERDRQRADPALEVNPAKTTSGKERTRSGGEEI